MATRKIQMYVTSNDKNYINTLSYNDTPNVSEFNPDSGNINKPSTASIKSRMTQLSAKVDNGSITKIVITDFTKRQVTL